ncbi:hypothetical protein PMIN07_004006 [Paraphaeosphaeria minitans]
MISSSSQLPTGLGFRAAALGALLGSCSKPMCYVTRNIASILEHSSGNEALHRFRSYTEHHFWVKRLHMNLKMKAITAAILAFAAIDSIATMIRMRYIHNLTYGADFLYARIDVTIWSTAEPGRYRNGRRNHGDPRISTVKHALASVTSICSQLNRKESSAEIRHKTVEKRSVV